MSRRLRSVWGVTPILNIQRNAEAEALLGIESETLVFNTYHTTTAFTRNFSRFCPNKIMKFLVPWFVFPWALFRYDIFHYFFDRGILPSWNWRGISALELMLLRLFGKKVFVYTYGADVRTRETTRQLGAYHCCLHCPAVGRACVCDEKKKDRILERVRRRATALFSMGDMTEYVPDSRKDLFF